MPPDSRRILVVCNFHFVWGELVCWCVYLFAFLRRGSMGWSSDWLCPLLSMRISDSGFSKIKMCSSIHPRTHIPYASFRVGINSHLIHAYEPIMRMGTYQLRQPCDFQSVNAAPCYPDSWKYVDGESKLINLISFHHSEPSA
jgi:hypothetical protein